MRAYLYVLGYVKLVTPNDIDWINDDIRTALLTSAYTPDVGADEFWSDVSTHEASGTGYTAGGILLTNKAVTVGGDGSLIERKADPAVWSGSTITARYAVVYKDSGVASTSPLIAYANFEDDVSSSASAFTVLWDAASGEDRVIVTRLLSN